jgi:hypothetical protein
LTILVTSSPAAAGVIPATAFKVGSGGQVVASRLDLGLRFAVGPCMLIDSMLIDSRVIDACVSSIPSLIDGLTGLTVWPIF